jgi:two-component system chemotaxis response regulator CheB
LKADKSLIDRWKTSEILLFGGSAGAFKILFKAVSILQPDLNKAVVIVMHRKKNYQSEIEKLFSLNSRLPLKEISDKDEISPNAIYIAPANYHTLIEKNGHFGLDVSEAMWYSKPSIDVTFESAADIYQGKATAILLSGANPDGARGMLKLKHAGALTIAQDPAEAEMPEMPLAAINAGAVDYILNTDEIFDLLQN